MQLKLKRKVTELQEGEATHATAMDINEEAHMD